MYIIVSICCWMYMVHCKIELDEFLVKIAKSAPQTRRNSLLAKYFANSEIFQNFPRCISLIAKLSALANFLLACWLILGPVV
jgi:hypothetical protein